MEQALLDCGGYLPLLWEFPAKRIGILGGTFNPPHNGHLTIARNLLAEFALARVVFLPAGIPPHKELVTIAGSDARKKMLELLIEGEPAFSLCTLELNRAGTTYTVDTLHELRRNLEPDVELYYIIGSDTLFELTTWKDFERVFSLTKFLCVPRTGFPLYDIERYAQELGERYGAKIHLSRSVGPQISSTQIRSLLKRGGDIRPYVPLRLAQYLENNHVFGS